MTTQDSRLTPFIGKFITAVVADENGQGGDEKEYLVEGAASGMVILREKGKARAELLHDSRVMSFEPPAEKVPVIKARRVNPVADSGVKRHLVDTHGYKVGDINGLPLAEAVALHDGIDHVAEDLGHFHAISKREAAIADAQSAQTDEGNETDD